MAGRKGVVVTESLNSSDELFEFLGRQGLCVLDAYQTWCGPCKPVQGIFKRLKTEVGADRIYFGLSDVDKIPELEKYKGTCEPQFLYFGGGQLTGYVKGTNAPVIERLCVELADHEDDVKAGKTKRKVIGETLLGSKEEKPEEGVVEEAEEAANEEPETPPTQENEEESAETVQSLSQHSINKCITLIILNPSCEKANESSPFMAKVAELGLDTLKKDEREISADDVKKIIPDISEDDLLLLSNGPCQIFAMTKGETGEKSIELAQEVINAGLEGLKGLNYTSPSVEQAEKDMNLFFSDFSAPKVTLSTQLQESISSKEVTEAPEQTLTIITPPAFEKHGEEILKDIEKLGFKIANKAEYQFTEENAAKYFEHQEDLASDEGLKAALLGGPALVLVLEKTGAVGDWRSAIGPLEGADKQAPESLRATYAVDNCTAILASSNSSQVERERAFFFGNTLEEQTAADEPAPEQAPAEESAPEAAVTAEEAPQE